MMTVNVGLLVSTTTDRSSVFQKNVVSAPDNVGTIPNLTLL